MTVYQSVKNSLTPEAIAAAVPRVIDCIDCHNRPTHIFHSPVNAVDLALNTSRIDPSIPHIKEQAVLALTGDYQTIADGKRGISESLTTFYQSKFADFVRNNPILIPQAAAETQRLYEQNFFPSMKVDWKVYPDNICHWDFPGCFRCHDGNHRSDTGKTITHSCTACHTIIAQGPPGNQVSSLAGLEFKHPVDIDGVWRDTNCSECHSGALAE